MMDSVLFNIGNFDIEWYSVLILTGVLLAYLLIIFESRRHDISDYFIKNLVFWAIIFSIIGARLYYVLFNWSYYSVKTDEIVQVWNGGLAIHGGIIFGLLVIIIYCKKYKVSVLKMTDITVVGLTIGQIIGRWGNFFNSEAYGPETTRKFLESIYLPNFIIDGMNINGIYFQPTFLYESLWMMVGFIILLIIRRRKYTKIGQITGTYMMWYGFGRFFIEILRQDSLMLGDLKVAQIVSIVLFIIGLIIVSISSKGSKFENLYGEKNEQKIKF